MEKVKKLKIKLIILLFISIPIFLLISTYFMHEKTKSFIIQNTIEQARKIATQLIIMRDHIATITPYIELKNETLHPFSFTPAYIGQEVAEELTKKTGYYVKQTSDNYRSTKNLPDDVEREMIKKLRDEKLDEYWEISNLNSQKSLRYAQAIYVKPECLSCHGVVGQDVDKQNYDKIVSIYGDKAFGYKVGDIRGIVSVAIPMQIVDKELDKFHYQSILTIAIVICLIAIFIYIEHRFVAFPQIIEIEKAHTRLQDMNMSLEEKVKNRTQELEKALKAVEDKNIILKENIYQLNNTKDKLILSEKMAILGNLIAGITQEINTPLGAIKSSSNVIEDDTKHLIKHLLSVVYEFSENDKKLFFEILSDSVINIKNVSTKDIREYKKTIKQAFDDLNIENSKELSNFFVKINIFNINKYIDKLKNDNILDILEVVANLINIIKNSSNINISVDKVNNIVLALKTFSKIENTTVMKKILLKDSIETVLTLYQNAMKNKIQVIKNYENLDSIYCYIDQIYQVWINILQNCLEAIDDSGTITIRLTQDDIYQIVKISDNGKGISKDIEDKVFEAFFTTKDTNKHRGLGLDIVRKIAENHNGKVEFTSNKEFGTEFKVYISKNNIE